jgi:Na+/phosphate symporter
MQLDSEFAGLLVAVGFLVLGLVSMPLAMGFVLGAIALGVVVALLLRFTPRKLSRVIVGTVIILAAPGNFANYHQNRHCWCKCE